MKLKNQFLRLFLFSLVASVGILVVAYSFGYTIISVREKHPDFFMSYWVPFYLFLLAVFSFIHFLIVALLNASFFNKLHTKSKIYKESKYAFYAMFCAAFYIISILIRL